MKYWLIGLGVVVALTQVLGGASARKVTGIYSSMHFNEEAGDVLGIEIYLVASSQGYVAVFQSSEGEPAVPVIVAVKIEGRSIRFDLPTGSAYAGTFTGTLTEEGIDGSFSSGRLGPSGENVIRLKRGQGYWQ